MKNRKENIMMSKAWKTMWKNIRRSPYQALAAIFIMMQTFLAISIFAFIIFGSAKTISYFESIPQVTGFFKDEAKQTNIDALKKQLLDTGKVTKVKFISKDEALQIYKEENKGDDPLLMDLVSADILPASLAVSTSNIDDLASIAEIMKSNQYIDKVVFQRDIIETLQNWTNALRRIGVVVIVLFALDSIFIMSIIISIKISYKREEIEIMRLLSATNWYIRWPFIYEGIAYGVIGAFLGWLFSVLILWYTTPFLQSFLGSIPILPVSPVFLFELLGGELLLAVILGWFASFMSVLRYLK